jgi:hypothetical protein
MQDKRPAKRSFSAVRSTASRRRFVLLVVAGFVVAFFGKFVVLADTLLRRRVPKKLD